MHVIPSVLQQSQVRIMYSAYVLVTGLSVLVGCTGVAARDVRWWICTTLSRQLATSTSERQKANLLWGCISQSVVLPLSGSILCSSHVDCFGCRQSPRLSVDGHIRAASMCAINRLKLYFIYLKGHLALGVGMGPLGYPEHTTWDWYYNTKVESGF